MLSSRWRARANIIRVERIKVILDSYGIDNDDILVGSGNLSVALRLAEWETLLNGMAERALEMAKEMA
jgi:hypothetical protein